MEEKVLLVVIIEKELEEDARRALKECGIDTFTAFTATGEGIKEHLNRWVDPEKVIILSVILRRETEAALKHLKQDAQMGAAGVGIAFTLPVETTLGVGVP